MATNTFAIARKSTLAGISRHQRAVVPNIMAQLGLSACTCGEEGDIATINAHVLTAPRHDFAHSIKRSTVKQDAPGEYWRYYCAICRWWSAGELSATGARNVGSGHRAIYHHR